MSLQTRAEAATPVLSVITPVYNVERYLPSCIESVLQQTLGNLELIVVDDGSTDGTGDVVARYAAQDQRVRGFRGPNRGVAFARNVAMRYARGRYFALLDGDDEWEPAFAETLVTALERDPEMAIVSGNGINMGGGTLDGTPVLPWPAEPHEIRFIDMIEREDSMFIMSVFRRTVYETIGGFNERLMRCEDWEYWMRAAASGFRVLSCPEPLARYRRRADSLTADQTSMFETMMKVLASAREFRKRPRAEELAAIDRQLDKLRGDWLLTKGKAALLRRDFAEARSQFWELYKHGRGVSWAAVSVGLGLAPDLVLSAYRARLESRPPITPRPAAPA